jgi:FkbM family methyltransferase
MLSRDEIVWGYRLVLGREPESDQIITHHEHRFNSIQEFRRALFDSTEFQHQLVVASENNVYAGYSADDLAVFDHFSSANPKPTPGFITDFHGSRARISSLWDGVRHLDGQVMPKPIPGDYHAETAEWLGLLKAVLAAKDQFVAMELGAGIGPWLVAGTVAARLRGIRDIRLLGVEADAVRFGLLQQNLRDNDINLEEHTLICGGVGALAGKAKWPRVPDPRNDAGIRPIRKSAAREGVLEIEDLQYMEGSVDDLVDVNVIAFDELLRSQPLWDLVHIDVQGTEVELCSSCLALMSKRVRYLVVGTHSRKLDGDLIALMFQAGWVLEHEKPTRFVFTRSANLERMTTADGIQVWRNPNL